MYVCVYIKGVNEMLGHISRGVTYIITENKFRQSYVLKIVLFRFEILYSTIDTLTELFK